MDGSRHLLQQRKEGRLGIGNKTGSSLASPIVFLSNSVAQALLACFHLPVDCRDQLLSSQYNTLHLQGYTLKGFLCAWFGYDRKVRKQK